MAIRKKDLGAENIGGLARCMEDQGWLETLFWKADLRTPNNLSAFVGQSSKICGPAVVRHHCSQQGHRHICGYLGLHPESSTAVQIFHSSLSALLLGANSASTDASKRKKAPANISPSHPFGKRDYFHTAGQSQDDF